VFADVNAPTMMELMHADIREVYKELNNETQYGFLHLMAGCSIRQLGAFNAESFCDRILSCANNLLSFNNTLLDDKELEMLVVLRMNRVFMEFMRANYGDLLREQFGMHVVLD
jgi:hypothetical protein